MDRKCKSGKNELENQNVVSLLTKNQFSALPGRENLNSGSKLGIFQEQQSFTNILFLSENFIEQLYQKFLNKHHVKYRGVSKLLEGFGDSLWSIIHCQGKNCTHFVLKRKNNANWTFSVREIWNSKAGYSNRNVFKTALLLMVPGNPGCWKKPLRKQKKC